MSVCKYGCGTKFGNYDLEKRKYYEEDNVTLHTWERHLEVQKSKSVSQKSVEMKPKLVSNGHEGFCTKWHESYKVLNPYWKCCPYCCDNLELI